MVPLHTTDQLHSSAPFSVHILANHLIARILRISLELLALVLGHGVLQLKNPFPWAWVDEERCDIRVSTR